MRAVGWETALVDYLASLECEPFAWGRHDCATFVAGAHAVLTGRDAPVWPGGYKTAKGSARQMKRMGFSGVADAATKLFGAPLQTPLLAQRGDAVSMIGDDGEALGLCRGPDAVFVGPDGLLAVPLRACKTAWRVG